MGDTFKRPFLDIIAELRRGKAKHDMTDKFHALIGAVRDTGKKGEIVIKLTVEPKKNDDAMVEVTDTVVVKLPARSVASSTFFVTDDNNLTRDDPAQETFGGMAAVPDADDIPSQKKAN